MIHSIRTSFGRIAKQGIVVLTLCLCSCVSPVDYGPIEHSQYVENIRCNPDDDAKSVDQKHLQYFFVTSRLPDCRNEAVTLTNHRGDKVRHGRFSEPTAPSNPMLVIDSEKQWWDKLSASAQENDGRILVYVHGYRETFLSSSKDTAQIARLTNFNGPVIQYSWPSQGQLLKYAVDETNMYWDERNFRNFLKTLAKAEWTKEIILVSHSLGARLVIPAVEYVDENSASADSSNISNIILASPDIDMQNFERDMVTEILSRRRVKSDRRITVYASAKDSALGLSSDIHGYPRLGIPRCFNPFTAKKLKARGQPERCYPKYTGGLSIIDTTGVSVGRSGHSDYLRSAKACQDFASAVNGASNSPNHRQATNLPHVFTLPSSSKREKPDHLEICRRMQE